MPQKKIPLTKTDLPTVWRTATGLERSKVVGSYLLAGLGALAIAANQYVSREIDTAVGILTFGAGYLMILGAYDNLKGVSSLILARKKPT